jgi:hypothetical protein
LIISQLSTLNSLSTTHFSNELNDLNDFDDLTATKNHQRWQYRDDEGSGSGQLPASNIIPYSQPANLLHPVTSQRQ